MGDPWSLRYLAKKQISLGLYSGVGLGLQGPRVTSHDALAFEHPAQVCLPGVVRPSLTSRLHNPPLTVIGGRTFANQPLC